MWQELRDKDKWNKLVSSQLHAPFLQSWLWGEFQASLGRKVLRLVWQDKFFAQAIQMKLPGGFFYWYLPRPYLDDPSFIELQRMLSRQGALFLRIDPLLPFDHPLTPSWVQEGEQTRESTPPPLLRRGSGGGLRYIPSTQPQCTLLLGLKKSSDDLLSSMRPKTRYNINLAQKKGVVVGEGKIEEFLRLNKETTQRGDFVSHPDSYYRQMAQICDVKIWQAVYQNKVLASALIVYFGGTATYLHGASSNEDRNVMAPYLLHWEIIKDAQGRGYKYYDWWGINPPDENHPAYKKSWEGITRFKRGFGGEFVQNPPSFDLIYRPGWYRLYRLARVLI